jgi:hypothetical protein
MQVKEGSFPAEAAKKIRLILARSSPWHYAKSIGRNFISSGEPTRRFDELIATLELTGLFIVPGGELESWDQSAGGHGPVWGNTVLQKNLKDAPELKGAREFVEKLAKSFAARSGS